MSTAAGDAARDTKVYPICNPWLGKAGAEYERTFEPNFLASVGAHIKDKYSNAARHLVGKDPGGITPPTAAALAANANDPGTRNNHRGSVAAGAAAAARETHADSVVAFEQRVEDTLAALRQHIPVPSIQNLIDTMKAEVEADAPTAVQLGTRDANGETILPPVYSPGHPNAGAPLDRTLCPMDAIPTSPRDSWIYVYSLGAHVGNDRRSLHQSYRQRYLPHDSQRLLWQAALNNQYTMACDTYA